MVKTVKAIYIVACIGVMALPFAGMTFFRTDTTTENKTLAELPDLTEEGDFNTDYLSELGDYFNDHFAFRNYLVDADSRIMSGVFGESNVDTVLVGTDGWLYYTATVDNYLGQNLMSERTVNNCAHNMKLLQDYVESQGAKFVLAVPPNKNSLYGDNMPYYYSYKVSDESNLARITTALSDKEVNYADLYALFSGRNDVMYLKRDSHWNNMGALLAYDEIMDKLELTHETYESTKYTRSKDYVGDLNSMIYPISSQPEWNLYVDENAMTYSYVTDTASVEDIWIETQDTAHEGSLLMFRDSFGNTLLPYMANAFGSAYFSKNIPYNIASYMSQYKPDTVVVEKVERNMAEFATDPAVFEGPTADDISLDDTVAASGAEQTSVSVCEAESNVQFWQIDGQIDASVLGDDGVVYVEIKSGDETTVYEAFGLTTDDSDYGYRLYLDKNSVTTDDITITAYAAIGDKITQADSCDVKLSTVQTVN